MEVLLSNLVPSFERLQIDFNADRFVDVQVRYGCIFKVKVGVCFNDPPSMHCFVEIIPKTETSSCRQMAATRSCSQYRHHH